MKFYIIPFDYQNQHQSPRLKDLAAFWPPGQLVMGHQAGQLWYCCWFASAAAAAGVAAVAASPGHPVLSKWVRQVQRRLPLHMMLVSEHLKGMPCVWIFSEC